LLNFITIFTILSYLLIQCYCNSVKTISNTKLTISTINNKLKITNSNSNNNNNKLKSKSGTAVGSTTALKLDSNDKIALTEEEIQEQNNIKSGMSEIYPQNSKNYFRKLFSFTSPLSKCIEENCQYCCLNLNFCGSKAQCDNSKFTMKFFKVIFISICIIIAIFFIYKIYITDPENEHGDSDKLDDRTLLNLIQLFIHNRENRRKFRYSSAIR